MRLSGCLGLVFQTSNVIVLKALNALCYETDLGGDDGGWPLTIWQTAPLSITPQASEHSEPRARALQCQVNTD